MSSLFETYRPKSWGEVIAQDKAVTVCKRLAERKAIAGRAFWIAGPSGVGKTTIARLLASEIASQEFVTEIDATDLTPAALRDIERSWWYSAWGKGGKAYIINEAHGLRSDTVRQWLVLLERISRHTVVIFTTTNAGQDLLFGNTDDAGPLLSRCLRIDMSQRGLAEAFALRVQEIATTEGLNGRPIADYIRLAKDCRNNMRAMLQAVEAGKMLAQ
jgi:DNA polymerase III gamma/tau subunit